MKKHILGLLLCFISFFSVCHAGGGITHMFLAEDAISKLPDPKLRHLLMNNLDAYLVGSFYPDSGYIKGTQYGEDSHWDPFIYAFSDYLNSKYADPISENPRLVAFLFGCAAHRVSDEIIHWTFYAVSKDKDFNGDYDKAHSYGDTGIDLLVNIDKNLWFNQPSTWWVPVKDLVEIYHRMGKDEYTANQIIWGNIVISFAGFGSRMISAPAYPILKWKMPWTAKHYYDWPEGGMLMDKDNIIQYQMSLWNRLKTKTGMLAKINPKASLRSEGLQPTHTDASPMSKLAEHALESGIITIPSKTNDDGSVELQQPIINQFYKLQTLIKQFLSDFLG